jgi:magnesium-protoporphyrin O-methyltransferase
MSKADYITRRGELETYFDRTAVDAWKTLTSDAPVGRIRATVRAGRDAMRDTLLSWLPADMSGLRILDAGCGTGSLAVIAAHRGAHVVAIDVSPTLVSLAQERAGSGRCRGKIEYAVGDMLDPSLGQFDHIVAMDSLIHYEGADIAQALAALAQRTNNSVVFTVAPRTPALTLMHAAGKFFPRGNKSPAIVPITPSQLTRYMRRETALNGWDIKRDQLVSSGFYKSLAMELRHS